MDLYDTVCGYSELGDHRTGTATDHATADWISHILGAMGAEVSRQPYTFPMFTGVANGTGSAENIELEPLYYSAVGQHRSSKPHIASITFDHDHSVSDADTQIEQIKSDAISAKAKIAVVTTGDKDDALCAINRSPAKPGDLPFCLAAGSTFTKLNQAPTEICFEASITNGSSANIIAHFPCSTSTRAPQLITTPLSGWFTCAGERGTGIAIAVSIAKELSRRTPVLLVMPTGHELGFYGAERFVESFQEQVSGVLHLGSCLAERGARMRSVSNLSGLEFEKLASALKPAKINPEKPSSPLLPAEWIGESELWAPRGVPMVSVAGTSSNFHTRQDIPENATDPDLLNAMRACVLEAAGALIR